MSSTNRGGVREISDYYVTPKQAVRNFIDAMTEVDYTLLANGTRVLDPCAGGDEEFEMTYPSVLHEYNPNLDIDTYDIRTDSRAKFRGDYLETTFTDRYDLIITNPPFALAMPIIKRSFESVRNNGYVVMLLRLNYFGSKKRHRFWQEHLPDYVFVHSERMDFMPWKKGRTTDSIEYMHAVWVKGSNPSFAALRVI